MTAEYVRLKNAEFVCIQCAKDDDLFDFIKAVEGASYNNVSHLFKLPVSLEVCYALKELKITFSDKLKKVANDMYKQTPSKALVKLKIPDFKMKLMPFQEEGVLQIDAFNGRCLLADEMGLGKTIQSIAWVLMRKKQALPVAIVCPASLKLNWKQELLKATDGLEIFVCNGTKPIACPSADVIIINYDIVRYWLPILTYYNLKTVILDEAHYIKSAGTKKSPVLRTDAVKNLCKGVPHVIAITGTPIENTVSELFVPCSILKPRLFPSEWHFKMKYCGAKHNGFSWTYNGVTHSEELHAILRKNVMIRRLKKDVLKDLPDKTYTFIPLEIDNRKEYERAVQNFIGYLQENLETDVLRQVKQLSSELDGIGVNIDTQSLSEKKLQIAEKANALTRLSALRMLSIEGKLKESLNWIEDFLESGEKLVVFATHKVIVDAVMQRFAKVAVKIDGGVSSEARQKAVNDFQTNKKIKLFVGNIDAAGVGLTLTAASNVAFLEYPWTPGKLNQAVDRVHRISQKMPVTCFFLCAINTIDERFITLLHSKQQVADAVLTGVSPADQKNNLISELLQYFKK